jgi:tetratricopeptide (TPR) repeat protein
MGLVNEAIAEFQIASRGKSEAIKSFEMLGMCFLDKGEVQIAVRQFERGLAIEGHRDNEYIGLHFNLGLAYEMEGQFAEALKHFENTYVIDIEFADVVERIAKLRAAIQNQSSGPSPGPAQESGPAAPTGEQADAPGKPSPSDSDTSPSGEQGQSGERSDDDKKSKDDRISYV